MAQRPLSYVQYLVLYLSRLQRIYLSQYLKLQFSILSTANTCQAVRVRRNFMMLDAQKTSIAIRGTSGKVIIVYSSMDSNLEAFSYNPTDGSLAALAFQLTAVTNYLNQRFLSYWVGLLFRQRTHQ